MQHRTGFAPAPGDDGRHDAHAVEPGTSTAVCAQQVDIIVESDWHTVRVRRCRLCLRALDPHRARDTVDR